MHSTESSQKILERFLSISLSSAEGVFAEFENLPGAITGRGKTPLDRYVCIPGTGNDRIVLVAHCDTVWDESYGRPAETTVVFEDGLFRGTNPDCGLGADDRAGCALLWALRDCGHTLLLVSGEEKGKVGARFLKENDPKLFRWLNRHRFMIELDWQGTGGCLFNQVDYTTRFYRYITETLKVNDDKATGGCDLQILCHRICGANIGVGYHGHHRPGEYLSLAEWENTLAFLRKILSESHPKFPISKKKRIRPYLGAIKRRVFRLLRVKKRPAQ